MKKNVIGIIPCKEHSERLPHKNVLKLGGKWVFEWSVEYAINEGVRPIVSTDNDKVVEWCKTHGIDYYIERVDDSNMCNCINQVLTKYKCDAFSLLQPSSPLRERGLLSDMIALNYPSSVYTAVKTKIIGHIGGSFMTSYRDQDATTKFLYQFDGNIVVVDYDWYARYGVLFDDTSKWVLNKPPYCFQIDTKDDFDVISKIVKFDRIYGK